jgi:hypothetical protein
MKIDIITLGDIYPVNIDKIKNYIKKSTLFSINTIEEIRNPIDINIENYYISDNEFQNLGNRKTNSNFTIGIIDKPLEGNYFSRRISDKLIVISVHNIEILNIHDGIDTEMYIMRFIYAFVTIYSAFGNKLPESAIEIMNKNSSGCLFDFCQYKPDVVKFFRNPHLSSGSMAFLETRTLPQFFIKKLSKEIKKLKIARYYTLIFWLKKNPILSIIVTFLLSFIFNELLGNYIYDLIK